MAALWGNLLTKLKHIKVKHKAVSPHLIRDSRAGQKERGGIKTSSLRLQRNMKKCCFYFNNACGKLRLIPQLDLYYVTIISVEVNTDWWTKLLDL